MKHPLANYQEERLLFKTLLDSNCPKSILMFRGGSGIGKTTLLNSCLQNVPNHIKPIPFELKQATVTVAEVFDRVGEYVGWEHFSYFKNQLASFLDVPTIHIAENRQEGSNNQINVALGSEHAEIREHRRAELTKAWFADLRNLPHITLLSLDTYEKATTEVKTWVESRFLPRVPRVPKLRVLVAGQEVPDAQNIEWSSYCEACDLFGISDAQQWLSVVNALDRRIDAPDPLSWLAGICYALKGRPKDIVQIIENLPHKRSGL